MALKPVWPKFSARHRLGTLAPMKDLYHSIASCIYIYMLSCSVLTSFRWYGPPRPWAPAQRPTSRLCKAACLPYLPLFPHLVKFLANTMQFNTTCKDLRLHQPAFTPIHTHHRSTGGQAMTMRRGGGRSDTGAYIESIPMPRQVSELVRGW